VKSSILKVVLLPMLAGMVLFSVGCSDTPSKPPATNASAKSESAKSESVKSEQVAEAATIADVAKKGKDGDEEPTQPLAHQASGSARQPRSVLPKNVRRVPKPKPVVQPVRDNGERYFVQTNDGDALNLRASNSTNSAVVGSLPYGTEVILHSSDRYGEWAEVSAPGNKRGWVAMRFLSQEAAPAPAPAPSDDGGRGSSGYYIRMRVSSFDGDNVNIRSGPSLEDAVVGVLAPGETVTRMGEVGQWTEVDTGNGTGFVASEYLVED
jgi:uncharacterized protein YraI